MRRRHDPALLRQIAAIRDLQRVAAEGEAARAASALRERQEARAESERQRFAAEQSWSETLDSPPLHIELARLWSAIVRQREGVVLQASADADSAAAELERRTTNWHAARMRGDSAHGMARKAVRARQHARDETALQDAADRHAQRSLRA